MQIRPANFTDLPNIEWMYTEAIRFQREAGHPCWRDLDLAVVESDIATGCQQVLERNGQVAGIFSLCPPSPLDEDLWHGLAPGSALYVNRIIIGPAWRGQRLLAPMLAWCEKATRCRGLPLLRLDTWAQSDALIRHYAAFGFRRVGARSTSMSDALPPQYRGLRLVIMERALDGA